MLESYIELLRCPLTRSRLTLHCLKKTIKFLDGAETEVIEEGILFAVDNCFYPVVKGIPRLNVEAVLDYADFLQLHLPDYKVKKEKLFTEHGAIIQLAAQKNRRTKKSFMQEWALYDNEKDKTWNADAEGILNRFLKETNESIDTLKGKIIFDAGCGNGSLNCLLAEKGITNIAMDFSNSIEIAYAGNKYRSVFFIQGDVQFPPVAFDVFDIVHCSGVLIHTNNTEVSFDCIEATVKKGGKLSVWLYHPRKNFLHKLFNFIRKFTSRLPLKFQYYLYCCTILPVSFVIKRLKGNKENIREMMVSILDWFTPEYRWEHTHEEAAGWFKKRNYSKVKITTDEVFGFNIIGEKNSH
ncbi:methyltransferase domain-containing protein [Ferruginibacter sp.]